MQRVKSAAGIWVETAGCAEKRQISKLVFRKKFTVAAAIKPQQQQQTYKQNVD